MEELRTYFHTGEKVIRAVDDVGFQLARGETLGLAGESGCGKSVTALSVMRLIQPPAGEIVGGRVFLEGRDLLRLSEDEMRRVRGREIAMVFQEPMTSLNPVFTVGSQIMEVFATHFNSRGREAQREAEELLGRVGLPDPERRFREYPHQMSGGMRQRVLIAMALAGRPKVLIADEPTTALDVTIQAQILELIARLRDELGMGTLLITHDLGIMAETTHRVAIMYAGRIVETAPVTLIFRTPWHPYTEGLLRSLPSRGKKAGERLSVIPGTVPELWEQAPGCPFYPRCYRRRDECLNLSPPLEMKREEQFARCIVPPEGQG